MLYYFASRVVMLIFFVTMLFVTIAAYSRKSGNTGIDIANIHLLRGEKKP
ncbi:MAG: hypothetical protein ACSNEK_03175 [Parachlamydiaceae bacterium]